MLALRVKDMEDLIMGLKTKPTLLMDLVRDALKNLIINDSGIGLKSLRQYFFGYFNKTFKGSM